MMTTAPDSLYSATSAPESARRRPAADAGDRSLPRARLAAIALLAACLRMWRLDRDGYGNEYYAAGVRSMIESWHNFFFNAFDPAGFVSLDKPPVAFWIQAASAKLLGFGGVSLLLPEALEGTLTVVLLYGLVSRAFGQTAGLLAALFLAITPIAVATDRSNNTDACLVFVLMLAAWALIRAAKSGGRPWLLATAALVGLAFNVKMLAAFVVIPTFVLAYFMSAPLSLGRRLIDLTMAAAVVAAVSFSWISAYDLTPPDRRPFAGSSTDNSMLELAIGHNGLQRFLSRPRPDIAAPPAVAAPPTPDEPAQPLVGQPAAAASPGPLRLLDPRLADQVGWLLPLTLFGFGLLARRAWNGSRRMLNPDFVVWAGWAATYAAVYSGLTRLAPYYLVTLGPPFCALAGVGAEALWLRLKTGGRRMLAGAGVLVLTAFWQVYLERGYAHLRLENTPTDFPAPEAWLLGLSLAAMIGVAVAVAGAAAARPLRLSEPGRRLLVLGSFGIGLAALLANPLAWSVSAVLAGANAARPEADLLALDAPASASGRIRRGQARSPETNQKLVAFLQANHKDETFLLATLTARQAAPVIIQTGDPVAALGGFSGADPIVSLEGLAGMVEAGQLRYAMIGGADGGAAFPGAHEQEAVITDWVKNHGVPVDPTLWRTPLVPNGSDPTNRPSRRRSRFNGADVTPIELYDLKPADSRTPPG